MNVGATACMLAVKDHTRSGHSRVEADDKIGEVQRRHAQDGTRTKQGSKKKKKISKRKRFLRLDSKGLKNK